MKLFGEPGINVPGKSKPRHCTALEQSRLKPSASGFSRIRRRRNGGPRTDDVFIGSRSGDTSALSNLAAGIIPGLSVRSTSDNLLKCQCCTTRRLDWQSSNNVQTGLPSARCCYRVHPRPEIRHFPVTDKYSTFAPIIAVAPTFT